MDVLDEQITLQGTYFDAYYVIILCPIHVKEGSNRIME